MKVGLDKDRYPTAFFYKTPRYNDEELAEPIGSRVIDAKGKNHPSTDTPLKLESDQEILTVSGSSATGTMYMQLKEKGIAAGFVRAFESLFKVNTNEFIVNTNKADSSITISNGSGLSSKVSLPK